MINETWASFARLLSQPASRPKQLNGAPDSQALIDQPLMRRVVNELALADPLALPPKPATAWSIIDGGSALHYTDGAGCALHALPRAAACNAVQASRGRTAFLAQLVRARPSRDATAGAVVGGALAEGAMAGGAMVGGAMSDGPHGGGALPRAERIALAPDWLSGRGCLTHVRRPRALLRAALPAAGGLVDAQRSHCAAAPVQLAPGAGSGFLVAPHFMYSMALKRERAFRAFGWDLRDARNRSDDGLPGCWDRSDHATLFGHTFFAQSENKTVLCAMPRWGQPAYSCCESLP